MCGVCGLWDMQRCLYSVVPDVHPAESLFLGTGPSPPTQTLPVKRLDACACEAARPSHHCPTVPPPYLSEIRYEASWWGRAPCSRRARAGEASALNELVRARAGRAAMLPTRLLERLARATALEVGEGASGVLFTAPHGIWLVREGHANHKPEVRLARPPTPALPAVPHPTAHSAAPLCSGIHVLHRPEVRAGIGAISIPPLDPCSPPRSGAWAPAALRVARCAPRQRPLREKRRPVGRKQVLTRAAPTPVMAGFFGLLRDVVAGRARQERVPHATRAQQPGALPRAAARGCGARCVLWRRCRPALESNRCNTGTLKSSRCNSGDRA
jgi:hypothetical protein